MTSIFLALLILSAQEPAAKTDSVTSNLPAQVIETPQAEDSIARARLKTAQEAWDRNGTEHAQSAGSPVSGSSLGSLFLQLFTSLALLAALGFAGVFVFRKARGKKLSGPNGSLVDILETMPLPGGRQIALVRIHDRVVAVAFSAGSASAISEFTGASAAEIIAETGLGKTSVSEFAATLDTLMDRFRHPPASRRPA